MKESDITVEQLTDKVNDNVRKHGRSIVVVSEGFPMGDIGETKDSFGHTQFSASKITVGQKLVNHLNEVGIGARGAARVNVSGTDQRHNMIYASAVDLEEAYRVGQKAVMVAKDEGSGYMATILRRPGDIYMVDYDKVPLEKVANSEREFPAHWITDDRSDVTDDFVRYARPLIGEDWVSVPLVNGIQRLARIKPVFAGKKCKTYVPQEYAK